MNALTEQQLETHVPVVGWMLIVSNALFLLIGGFILLLLLGVGFIAQDAEATGVLLVVGTMLGVLFTALAIPGIAAGAGLLSRRTWGRILAIVVAGLSLTNFPLGTVIGAYTLYVLLQESAGEYFCRRPGDGKVTSS